MNDSNKVVAVRLDESVLRRVEDFAEMMGLVGDAGELNISAALRALIALGLGENTAAIETQIYRSAKGAALHEITLLLQETLRSYNGK